MLKKKNRLVSDYEFNKVYRLGENHKSLSFDIFYLDVRDYDGPSKIGIVVSNKFSKVAPKRNRTKRVFREAVRNNLEKIKDGFWVVIKPKEPSKDKKYEEINEEFNKVLSKISISRKLRG